MRDEGWFPRSLAQFESQPHDATSNALYIGANAQLRAGSRMHTVHEHALHALFCAWLGRCGGSGQHGLR